MLGKKVNVNVEFDLKPLKTTSKPISAQL